jgi:hypothetical protein
MNVTGSVPEAESRQGLQSVVGVGGAAKDEGSEGVPSETVL